MMCGVDGEPVVKRRKESVKITCVSGLHQLHSKLKSIPNATLNNSLLSLTYL